jgi:hypothetical protein
MTAPCSGIVLGGRYSVEHAGRVQKCHSNWQIPAFGIAAYQHNSCLINPHGNGL